MRNHLTLVTIVAAITISGCAEVVFTSDRDGLGQIYKMRANGDNQSNLSNNLFTDHFADVSPDRRTIVFSTLRNEPGENIYVMNSDGSAPQGVTTGQLQRTRPRWSSDMTMFAYAFPSFRGNAKLWTVAVDGTNERQLTSPAAHESDDNGHDFYDNNTKLIFSRYDSNTQRRDLYWVTLGPSLAVTRITNTPNVDEVIPVVSHSGELVAYRAFVHSGGGQQSAESVRILEVGTWNLVHEFQLQPPADKNINGLGFSRSDRRLYVGIESSDVPGTLINNKQEIFSVRIDGTRQRRLTNNETPDHDPSAVPCSNFFCRLADWLLDS